MYNYKVFILVLIIVFSSMESYNYFVEKKRLEAIEANKKFLQTQYIVSRDNAKKLVVANNTINQHELSFIIKWSDSINGLAYAFEKNRYPLEIYDLKDSVSIHYNTKKRDHNFYNYKKNSYAFIYLDHKALFANSNRLKPSQYSLFEKKGQMIHRFRDKSEFSNFILNNYMQYYKIREKITPNLYTHSNNNANTVINNIHRASICIDKKSNHCEFIHEKIRSIEYQSFTLPPVMTHLIAQEIKEKKYEGKSDAYKLIGESMEIFTSGFISTLKVYPLTRRVMRIARKQNHDERLFGYPSSINQFNSLLPIYPNINYDMKF